jgi:hypothetical protein
MLRDPLNGITSLPNFMKIHQAVQNLLVGQTDRQTGDFISLLSFLESRLKSVLNVFIKAQKFRVNLGALI